MKELLFAFLMFFAPPSAKADVCTFAWEYDQAVKVDGFRLYLKSGDQYTWLWTGCYTSATVGISHGTKGFVVCRAFLGNKESEDSVPYYIKLVGKPKR